MADNRLHLQVISPSGILYEGDIHHATFPGELGSFSIYPLHAPIISSLAKGEIGYYANNTEKQVIKIESGFVEVKNNQIIACVEE